MENKKIDVVFCVILIVFLVMTVFLIKDFNAKRASDFKAYANTVTNVMKQSNEKIRSLYSQLVAEQKENQDLRNTLADTRNSLDGLSKKLAQPALVAVPVGVSAAAVTTK